jgi:hypothetical protein
MMVATLVERKKLLLDHDLKAVEIARACRTTEATVSRVLAGTQRRGPKTWAVMMYIAERVGLSVDDLFPGADAAGVA